MMRTPIAPDGAPSTTAQRLSSRRGLRIRVAYMYTCGHASCPAPAATRSPVSEGKLTLYPSPNWTRSPVSEGKLRRSKQRCIGGEKWEEHHSSWGGAGKVSGAGSFSNAAVWASTCPN